MQKYTWSGEQLLNVGRSLEQSVLCLQQVSCKANPNSKIPVIGVKLGSPSLKHKRAWQYPSTGILGTF